MAADMVHVGCKMPQGVTLDLDRCVVVDEARGIVRVEKGKLPPVTLKGNALKFGQPDISIEGYVFTAVPKDFWDEWLSRNAESPLLTDGFIKPAISLDAAKKIAREHEKERGQFPRLTENDERVRGLGVKKFDPKDEAA